MKEPRAKELEPGQLLTGLPFGLPAEQRFKVVATALTGSPEGAGMLRITAESTEGGLPRVTALVRENRKMRLAGNG